MRVKTLQTRPGKRLIRIEQAIMDMNRAYDTGIGANKTLPHTRECKECFQYRYYFLIASPYSLWFSLLLWYSVRSYLIWISTLFISSLLSETSFKSTIGILLSISMLVPMWSPIFSLILITLIIDAYGTVLPPTRPVALTSSICCPTTKWMSYYTIRMSYVSL